MPGQGAHLFLTPWRQRTTSKDFPAAVACLALSLHKALNILLIHEFATSVLQGDHDGDDDDDDDMLLIAVIEHHY